MYTGYTGIHWLYVWDIPGRNCLLVVSPCPCDISVYYYYTILCDASSILKLSIIAVIKNISITIMNALTHINRFIMIIANFILHISNDYLVPYFGCLPKPTITSNIDEYINKLGSVSFIIIKYLILASFFGKGSQNLYSQSYKYKETRHLY